MRDEQAVVALDPQTGILTIHLPQVASLDVIREALTAVVRDAGPAGIRRRLWDGRRVVATQDLDPVRGTALIVRDLLGPGAEVGRAAILAGDERFFEVASRYVEGMPEGYPLRVFRGYDEAVDWLLS